MSASLQRAVQDHPFGGEIVRAQKDGTYTDLGGHTVEKVEKGGWSYKDDDEGKGEGGGGEGGGGRLNHPMGQEADRVPVKEYLNNPNTVPMVPLPMPMPMPMPMPLPVPAIPAPAPMPIPIFP